MTLAAESSDPHVIRSLPVLVLLPHNRCNCRCVMCDIWRIREVREITAADLQPHLDSLRALKVRWVVFSGGEAQMHSDLESLANLFRAEGIRITLLTAGLLLADTAAQVVRIVDDVIVSLDGPPELHDHIRRVPGAFARLREGVSALRGLRPDFPISARSTVQKMNFSSLRATVAAARALGIDSISFLATDTSSVAFNREKGWSDAQSAQVALTREDVAALSREVELLSEEEGGRSFVAENADKLRRIVRHFQAQIGEAEARAPRCNAPWTSAVVEANGDVRPCFFHPAFGNIHRAPLLTVLNSPTAIEFRRHLDVENNEQCRKCVCSLYWKADNNVDAQLLEAVR